MEGAAIFLIKRHPLTEAIGLQKETRCALYVKDFKALFSQVFNAVTALF